MQHFALVKGEQVLCALTLSIAGKAARLDDVGTDIAFQGNGYASYLIEQALTFAEQQGVSHCYLDASSQGLSIYEKLGFSPLFQYHAFISPEL